MTAFSYQLHYYFIVLLCWAIIFSPRFFSLAFEQYEHIITFTTQLDSSDDSALVLGDTEKQIDPSIFDMIILTLTGSEQTSQGDRKGSNGLDSDSADGFVNNLKNITLPLRKLVSDGEFTINIVNSSINYDDIVLLEEEYFRKYFCNPFHDAFFLSKELEDQICKCQNSYPEIVITHKDNENYFYSNFCPTKLSKPCEYNSCKFRVNPWMRSLVFITKTGNEPKAVVMKVRMGYRLIMPEWTSLTQKLKYFFNSLKSLPKSITDSLIGSSVNEKTNNAENEDDSSTSSSFIFDIFYNFLDILEKFLVYVPYYVGNLLLGYILLVYGEEIARNLYFQMLIMGSLGVLCAIVVAFYVIFRVFEKMFKSFSTGAFGIAASLGAFAFTSSILIYYQTVFQMTTIYAIQLWDEGLFGYKWIIKLYYLLSFILFSWASVRYELFVAKTVDDGGPNDDHDETMDTIPLKILSKFITFLGIYLLYNGSSNHFLMILILLYILLEEEFSDYYRVFRVNMSNYTSKPPEYYSGRRLTLEEYNKEGDSFTQIELNKLRNKLRNDKQGQQKLHNIFQERGATFQSDNLNSFIKGSYSGRPPKDYSNDEDYSSRSNSKSFSINSSRKFSGRVGNVTSNNSNNNNSDKNTWFRTFVYNLAVIIVVFYIFVALEKAKLSDRIVDPKSHNTR